jgi:hypothetical protein
MNDKRNLTLRALPLLLTLALVACGRTSQTGLTTSTSSDARVPQAAAAEFATADALLAPPGPNDRVLARSVDFSITHTGAYKWESDPYAGIAKKDVWSQTAGFMDRGGTIAYATGERPRSYLVDTPDGLVGRIAFTVESFEGTPTVHVTRMAVSLGSPEIERS